MYIPYVFKELSRRRARTTTAVLTVAVVVVMLVVSTTVIDAYSSAMYLPFKNTGSDIILQKGTGAAGTNETPIRVPFGKAIFNDSEVSSISSLQHVQDVSKSLILWSFNKTGFVSMEGLEPQSPRGETVGSWVNAGRFIAANDSRSVVLESHFAKFNNLKVGSNLTLNGEPFTVIGTIKVGEGSQVTASNAYIPLSEAQRIGNVSGYDQLYVKIDSLANEGTVKTGLSGVDAAIISISGSSIGASIGNLANIYDEFRLLGIGMLLLIALLIVFKVNAMGLIERRRDIALLQSVGWTQRDITTQIAAEIMVQTVLGFIVGAAISAGIVTALGSVSIQAPSLGLESSTTTITMPLTLSAVTVGSYFILVCAVSLLVSYLLARRAAKIKPSENLRSL
ncbi:MAG: ABC transporter permease [Euryarchaeota archaeon]|nr:ABC transporter permease [Euryarchaeota archaeon]